MKTVEKFKFTNESLLKFDSIFEYFGTIEPGVWGYRNPFAENKLFAVQAGGGGVYLIDGWCPDGMSFEEIVEKLKMSK